MTTSHEAEPKTALRHFVKRHIVKSHFVKSHFAQSQLVLSIIITSTRQKQTHQMARSLISDLGLNDLRADFKQPFLYKNNLMHCSYIF